jgi:hypothetical protein
MEVVSIPEPIKCDNCGCDILGPGMFLYDGLGLWLFCNEKCIAEKTVKVWRMSEKEDFNGS